MLSRTCSNCRCTASSCKLSGCKPRTVTRLGCGLNGLAGSISGISASASLTKARLIVAWREDISLRARSVQLCALLPLANLAVMTLRLAILAFEQRVNLGRRVFGYRRRQPAFDFVFIAFGFFENQILVTTERRHAQVHQREIGRAACRERVCQ